MAGGLTLLIGGARSGKSAHALELARRAGGDVLFVATAEPLDREMAARIARHRSERPAGWRTLEAPRNAGRAIREEARGARVVLVDCLTLLVANALGPLGEAPPEEEASRAARAEVRGLLEACAAGSAAFIIVSNEVGLGVVPPSPLGRAFQDALGRANQEVAAAADRVLLLVAGIPLAVKGEGR